MAAIKGEKSREYHQSAGLNLDRVLEISGAALGGIAVILGVLGFASGELVRVAGGAAVLGAGAIAFRFDALAPGAIVVAIADSGCYISAGFRLVMPGIMKH